MGGKKLLIGGVVFLHTAVQDCVFLGQRERFPWIKLQRK